MIRTIVAHLPPWLAAPLRRLWRRVQPVLLRWRGVNAVQTSERGHLLEHLTGDNLRAAWHRFGHDPHEVAFVASPRRQGAGGGHATPATGATATTRASSTISSFGLSSIRYEEHPAFAGVPFCSDLQIETFARELSAKLDRVREMARLPSTDVAHQVRTRISPAIARLFAALKEKNRGIAVFGDFAERLEQKVLELVDEDMAVFADRGTHAYVNHSPQADAITQSLHDAGFWLGQFDASKVKLLNSAVVRAQSLLWERHERERRNDREALSTNQWDAEASASLAAVFNEPAIITGVSNYMGAYYYYSGCGFELSVPATTWWSNRYHRGDESRESAYYHLDQSSKYPKLICYLTDVGEENGPTSLVLNGLSQSLLSWVAGRALDGMSVDPDRGQDTNMGKMLVSTETGRMCFGALPREMRCLGHFGNDILAGSSEERHIVDNRTVMLGPAGSLVVFDGSRTAHRGGIVTSQHRWAFQAVYAKMP